MSCYVKQTWQPYCLCIYVTKSHNSYEEGYESHGDGTGLVPNHVISLRQYIIIVEGTLQPIKRVQMFFFKCSLVLIKILPGLIIGLVILYEQVKTSI